MSLAAPPVVLAIVLVRAKAEDISVQEGPLFVKMAAVGAVSALPFSLLWSFMSGWFVPLLILPIGGAIYGFAISLATQNLTTLVRRIRDRAV